MATKASAAELNSGGSDGEQYSLIEIGPIRSVAVLSRRDQMGCVHTATAAGQFDPWRSREGACPSQTRRSVLQAVRWRAAAGVPGTLSNACCFRRWKERGAADAGHVRSSMQVFDQGISVRFVWEKKNASCACHGE